MTTTDLASTPPSTFTMTPIGVLHSCFKEKFGIPRQPGLAPAAKATLELLPPYNCPEAVLGLEQTSHLWLQFIFHHSLAQCQQWKPTVRPPRLGGNKRMGVFATRSPVRPNALGLSVVKLEAVEIQNGAARLLLSGVDLVDGTPVVDIKPYVPYVDSVPEAENRFADQQPAFIDVVMAPVLEALCETYQAQHGVELATLITQVLRQDPRPQYQTPDPERHYGMKLLDLDVRWRYRQQGETWCIDVVEIAPLTD